MKKIIPILILLALVAGVLYIERPKSSILGDYNGYPVYSPGTNTGVLCTASSTQIVATSTSRNAITISNISSNIVYVSFGRPATLYTGMAIASSSTLRLDSNLLYSGAIFCIAGSNSSTTVLELN